MNPTYNHRVYPQQKPVYQKFGNLESSQRQQVVFEPLSSVDVPVSIIEQVLQKEYFGREQSSMLQQCWNGNCCIFERASIRFKAHQKTPTAPALWPIMIATTNTIRGTSLALPTLKESKFHWLFTELL
ncbi:hypothetical protein BDF20DRAFT_838802 [Mycotypha africana]|uniref:uncharacterized protein n=1 Tax=Mycotypha africana TaxID=64632 RepID=UPI0022FFD535|nr:uncharacterized protein BDF20DRAFT_838802 [Mycotypha africana]KAI8970444.1 hypothetical protein BDF20DRAFT_838802 [Mycotypha africana]